MNILDFIKKINIFPKKNIQFLQIFLALIYLLIFDFYAFIVLVLINLFDKNFHEKFGINNKFCNLIYKK